MPRLSLTGNQLKLIAVLAMLFDHLVVALLPYKAWPLWLLRVPGRIAAPILCFQIAEGYHHTSNLKAYALRLLVCAAISHLPYVLCFGYGFFESTSVLWSLLLGLVALHAMRAPQLSPWLRGLCLLLCCALAFNANWNFAAVLWIVGFGLFHGDWKRQALAFSLVAVFGHLLPACLLMGYLSGGSLRLYQAGVFLALPLLALYNGKRGNRSAFLRWFFYAFYPAHLLLFYLLSLVL